MGFTAPMQSATLKSASTYSGAPLVQLSAAQLEALQRDGFLRVDDLSSPEELESLRLMYDRLFAEGRGWEAGDLFDMVGDDGDQRQLALPQMLWPSRYEPCLRQTRLAANAEFLAHQILGPKIENFLEHAVLKPPRHLTETPWHQDQAFNRKGSGFVESISIWMPLQDVNQERGCMRYIAGSNRGPLYPHRRPRNDPRVNGLELVSPPDFSKCVTVPLPAGSAVIHSSRTIHGAGGNSTEQPRRAYVLGYAVRGRRHQMFTRDYPWNLEKPTPREQRALRALPPLGRTILRLRRLLRDKKL